MIVKQFKLILVLAIFLSAVFVSASTARADSSQVYLRFRESPIVLWPGLHRKVILDYGNLLTNQSVNIDHIRCGLNPKYGAFANVNKVRFATYEFGFAMGGPEQILTYENDTLPPRWNASVSFEIDTTKAQPGPNPETSVTCAMGFAPGSDVVTATAPISATGF
jgi:hypothetical protein